MSREQEIVDYLLADATLTSILTGGIYTDELVGIQGIRRGDESPTSAAFDEDGYLKPSAIVRQRPAVPYGGIRIERDKIFSVMEYVEIYYFQWRNHAEIDRARKRIYALLQSHRFTRAYPTYWVTETAYYTDDGVLANATVMRQDWSVVSLRRPDED